MTDLSSYVDKQRVEDDFLDLFPARAMAALLDRDPESFAAGTPLPPGWHWLYFKPIVRRSNLGVDGHEKLGGFLPDLGLPRRMWAGGSLTYLAPLTLGEHVRRTTTIESIEEKSGRSGRLVFVTLRHRIDNDRGTAIDEVQNLVYREPTSAAAGEGPAAPKDPGFSDAFTADEITLFRFSALTFNGHRIHYDQPYATSEEGYPGIVTHGPLLALLLQDAALRHGGRSPARFAYRGVSPLFAGETFQVEGAVPLARDEAGETELWVAGPRGLAMRATAGWERR
jgi:3-methylfumaryl-CoA hydratase